MKKILNIVLLSYCHCSILIVAILFVCPCKVKASMVTVLKMRILNYLIMVLAG